MKKSLKQKAILMMLITGISLFNASPAFAGFKFTSTANQSSELKYIINPEEVKTDILEFENTEETGEITIELGAVDGTSGDNGVIAFKVLSQKQAHIGKWIQLEPSKIVLKPREKVQVKISIEPGKYATPGTYVGGLSMMNYKKNVSPTSNTSVKVSSRLVSKIFLTVPGEISNKYALKKFSYLNGEKNFDIGFTNQGNTLLRLKGNINVVNRITGKKTTIEFPETLIQKDESIEKKIISPIKDIIGFYEAKLNLSVDYYDGINDKYYPLGFVKNDINFNIIPWLLIIIILLITAVCIALYISKKRNDKKYLNECVKYQVKPGDTLTSIAKTYEMDWKKLAKINKILAPYSVTTNQEILVHIYQPKIKTNEKPA